MDEGVFELRNKIRSGEDRALETSQPFPCHTTGKQRLVVLIQSPITAQERQIRFADDNVVGRGVVVQFLVPFLDEPAGHFLDVVAVHNLENLIPDALTLAAAAYTRQHQPDQVAVLGLLAKGGGQFQGEAVLGVSQFARFGVVIALPIKLADGGKAEPDKQGRPPVPLVANLVNQIVTEVKAVHQRPTMIAHLAVHDLPSYFGKSGRRPGSLGKWNKKVLPAMLQPLTGRGLVKQKTDSGRRSGPLELKLQPAQML